MAESNGNSGPNGNGKKPKPSMTVAVKWRWELGRIRERRKRVEELMLAPMGDGMICTELSKEFPDSFYAIRKDITAIRKQWVRDDLAVSKFRRIGAIKRIARKLRATEEAKEWTANVAFERLLGQVIGYLRIPDQRILNQTVNIVSVRQTAIIRSQVGSFLDTMSSDEQEQLTTKMADARIFDGVGEGAVSPSSPPVDTGIPPRA